MPRIQPNLTAPEDALVGQVAQITGAKRSDVIRNAIAVYAWFVRQTLGGAQVVARRPTGEEVTLETPELAALEARGQSLSSGELGALAKKLAAAKSPAEAARLRERLTRGFYGL